MAAMELSSLVPEIIATHNRQTPWGEWIRGSVLFADVSGFTPMSEALSVIGADGAEILTDLLNRYFSVMIRIVHGSGGHVMKFGGDAILCFFPGEKTLPPSLQVGLDMQKSMSSFRNIQTPVGRFTLKMKIGIAEGDVLLGGVGDPGTRCEYLFAGDPVDLAAEAEHHASAGEVILAAPKDPEDLEKIHTESVATGFKRITGVLKTTGKVQDLTEPLSGRCNIEPFIIQEVRELIESGYQHHIGSLLGITSVFMIFKGFQYHRNRFDLPRFQDFFCTLTDVTDRFGGRLNRVAMGDKGSMCLFLFGAPKPLEQKEMLTCQWALELKKVLSEKFPDTVPRFGIHSGRVFAGIVGGAGRWEYTVMGDSVNVAARLTQAAGDWQIITSEQVKILTEHQYSFIQEGARKLKGKTEKLNLFSLHSRKRATVELKHSEVFVGREKEIRNIQDHLEQAKKGKPGLLIVEGDAGAGKSSLLLRVTGIAKKDGWTVLWGRGDITRRGHPYAPWKDIFHSLLFPDGHPSERDIRSTLKAANPDFLSLLNLYLDFFGISHGDKKATDGLDDETLRKRFHFQLNQFLKHALDSRPTMIILEDLHWMDSLSRDLSLTILDHLGKDPLLLLTSSRPDPVKQEFESRPACSIMSLELMGESTVSGMAQVILGGTVRNDLLSFLIRQTGGNPFFVRTTLAYLKEHGHLTTRLGEWTLTRESAIPRTLTGEDMIRSQISMLSVEEQEYLQASSCIGNIFHEDILKKILRSGQYDDRTLTDLCHKGYLKNLEKRKFIFSHAIIRDNIYRGLLLKYRRKLHRRIGESIESLYQQDLSPVLADLAHHYYSGEVRSKALKYSLSAGKQMLGIPSLPEACSLLEKAYGMLKYSKDRRKWDTGMLLAETYARSGNIQRSAELAGRLRIAAGKKGLKNQYLTAYAIQCNAFQKMGNYNYLNFAGKILTSPQKMDRSLRNRFSYLVGVANFRKGNTDTARIWLRKVISHPGKTSEIVLMCHIILANIYREGHIFDKSLDILDRGFRLADQVGDEYHKLRFQMEKATVYMESGKFDMADRLYQDLIHVAENMGDSMILAGILLNLSNLKIYKEELDQSETYLDEASDIFLSLGITRGYAECLNLKGIIFFFRGDYPEAYRHYLESMEQYEVIREWEKACYGYYNLAEVCIEMGHVSEARNWYKKGLQTFNAKDKPELAQMFRELRPAIEKS